MHITWKFEFVGQNSIGQATEAINNYTMSVCRSTRAWQENNPSQIGLWVPDWAEHKCNHTWYDVRWPPKSSVKSERSGKSALNIWPVVSALIVTFSGLAILKEVIHVYVYTAMPKGFKLLRWQTNNVLRLRKQSISCWLLSLSSVTVSTLMEGLLSSCTFSPSWLNTRTCLQSSTTTSPPPLLIFVYGRFASLYQAVWVWSEAAAWAADSMWTSTRVGGQRLSAIVHEAMYAITACALTWRFLNNGHFGCAGSFKTPCPRRQGGCLSVASG